MTDLDEGIVELYAEHLLKKASSVLVTFAVAGAVGGALIGAVPGLLSHSVISPGTNYFAVLLGAIAGGFLGRSIGDKRAVGLRLQAKMALHQLQIESRLVAAPPARPAAPAPAFVAPAVQAAPPLIAPAPVLAAPPVAVPPAFVPAPSPSAPAPLVPAAPAPPASSPAEAPLAPAIRTEPAPTPLPDVPRLVEPPALPPLSQLAPPLRADSTG